MANTVKLNYPALIAVVRTSPNLKRFLQPIATAATRECHAVAHERVERHTGALEGGYRSTVIPGGIGPVIAKIRTENAVGHANFIEQGTRPHRIPKTGETLLSWVDKGGRRITIIGHVQHPGTKAYNIIRDALRRVVLRRGFR